MRPGEHFGESLIMDWQFNISIGHKSIGIWQTHNLTWIHLKLANSVMQNGHLIRNGHLYRIDQIIFIDQLNNPGNMGLSRIILAQTWSWHQGGGGGGPGPGVGGPEEEGEEGSRSAMEEGGVHHLWLQGGLQYLRHPRHAHQWLHPAVRQARHHEERLPLPDKIRSNFLRLVLDENIFTIYTPNLSCGVVLCGFFEMVTICAT